MAQNPASIAHPQTVYWRRVQRLTCVLILIWFTMTFGLIFFARELTGIILLGWPFSFYMAAQGLTLSYVLIVAIYVICMQFFDKDLKDGSHVE